MKFNFQKFPSIVLILLFSFFATLAWYVSPILIFISFVFLFLYIEKAQHEYGKVLNIKIFGFLYLGFSLWNIGVTWWIVNSTWVGAALAFFINSFLMTLTVCVYLVITQKISPKYKFFGFIPVWISFELLHLNWDLTWSWLNLGNVFAIYHPLVQWYEFTGVLGGSMLILLVNILLFKYLTTQKKKYLIALLFAFLPFLISILQYNFYKEEGKMIEVVVVQPNIDPFKEKFPSSENFIEYDAQLQRMLDLTQKEITIKTAFVLWPETSLPAGYDEDFIQDQKHFKTIKTFFQNYPDATLITGSDTYKIYSSDYDKTETARFGDGVGWYDYFNSAIKIDQNYKPEIYHKSKLVPGVEKMPYPVLFNWLENFAIDLGGITGSLGTQDEREIFSSSNNEYAAPVICYESIFGQFIGEYCKKGAQFIAIITNDGWWSNTPGHVQHLQYAKLRAIETRKPVARAANTGISAFINQKGDIVWQNKYGIMDSHKMNILINSKSTFYIENGDYIGWISVVMLVIISVFSFYLIGIQKIRK